LTAATFVLDFGNYANDEYQAASARKLRLPFPINARVPVGGRASLALGT